MLFVVQAHQVLALEDEEPLRRVTMAMKRRAEARRLILSLQHGQVARRLVAGSEHDGLEVAQVQEAALTRKNDECLVHVPELREWGHDSNSRNEEEELAAPGSGGSEVLVCGCGPAALVSRRIWLVAPMRRRV
jgi:hypothetical protein